MTLHSEYPLVLYNLKQKTQKLFLGHCVYEHHEHHLNTMRPNDVSLGKDRIK